MRIFIAIEIPNNIKTALTEAQLGLKGAGAVDASWPHSEGIHLTLKFLGEISESKVPDIMSGLLHAVGGIGPFRLEVRGIGTFPNPQNARVVWVGLSGDVEKLAHLRSTVENALNSIGFKRDDRAFTPHLTLGRIKNIRSRDRWLKTLAEAKDFHLPGFDVASVSLIKSELKTTGAEYTEIGRIELK